MATYSMQKAAILFAAVFLLPDLATAQDAEDLSKKLQNPVSPIISVPIQNNFEFRGGPKNDGFSSTTNIEPVIPFRLNQDWNLVVRTILPVMFRDRYGAADANGIGDVTQSFFFTPSAPRNGVTWALGPVFQWPVASSDKLGTGKWGAGPTALLLMQDGAWTVGGLVNHIWSYAGPNGRSDVSMTLLQPFLSYGFGHGFSVSLNTETNYDWVSRQWTVPINVSASQVFNLGKQPVSASLGFKYYAVRPEDGPRWGVRAVLTLLVPER